MVDDSPLRHALEQTITGLKVQIPLKDKYAAEGFCSDDSSFEHLHWMLETCLTNLQVWPVDKISRWIGYVQGVMVARAEMNSEDERNRTRPIFHAAYEAMGFEKPKTLERDIDDLYQK